mgnify:CR=1 FL=1
MTIVNFNIKGNQMISTIDGFGKEKLQKVLADGKLAQKTELTDEEKLLVKDLHLITMKPFLYIYNVADVHQKLSDNLEKRDHVKLDIKIEEELIEMSDEEKAEMELTSHINDLIVDPGFGFAKTLEQNYEMLQKMELFQQLKLPVLVGISRKSMIYKTLNNNASESLNGTTTLNTISLLKGANILRVHDVKEAVECVNLYLRL